MRKERTSRELFFFRLRWYSLVSGTLLVFLLIAAGYVHAPFLKIKTITVPEVAPETQAAIIQELISSLIKIPRSAILGPDHYAAWPSSFPYTSAVAMNVAVEKDFWNQSITVKLTPRERFAIWCEETVQENSPTCYWIDQTGVAFERSPLGEGQLLRTIFATKKISGYEIGSPVTDASLFANIKRILDGTTELALTMQSIRFNEELQELLITTEQGTAISMSVRFDPTKTALPALKRFMSKPGLSSLSSINLTVENRAYLKYR